MRVAIYSDIHGNAVALDAVLADIDAAGGVDATWVVGDLAAMGPDPVGVLERLTDLSSARFVRGNTDSYVCGQLDPKILLESLKGDPAQDAAFLARINMLAWAQGALITSGWMNWMQSLELEQRITLPDGTRVLLAHAAPGTDDGAGIRPVHSDAEIAAALDGCEADLVFVGHTHWPLDRSAGGVRVVNLGSVSHQPAPHTLASYALLTADEQGHTVEQRLVDYDHDAVIAQMRRMQFPGVDLISAFMRGEVKPAWAQ